jgi:hypothetical protein
MTRQFKTEREFHAARRMFAVTDHGVLVAEAGDLRTHYEWLSSHFGDAPVERYFAETTRGYVLDGVLCAYKGQDFSRWVKYGDVVLALDEMEKHCGPIERVWLGVRRGKHDSQPWPPVVDADAGEFRSYVAKLAAEKKEKTDGDG